MPSIDSQIEDGLLLLYKHGHFTVWIQFLFPFFGSNYVKTRHQKRTWYGIIDFWEGTANAPSQIIAILAPSRILCHTSFSKLRLDPWVAETTVRIGDPGATRLEWEASGGQVRRAMPGRWELSGFNQWLAVKKCWHLRLGRSFQHVAIWWSSISLWGGFYPRWYHLLSLFKLV